MPTQQAPCPEPPAMYLPPQFASQDPRLAARLMREHPFASLITLDDEGLPFVTHLPLHLRKEEGGHFVLLGHVARPNPQWRHLQQRPRRLPAGGLGRLPDLTRRPAHDAFRSGWSSSSLRQQAEKCPPPAASSGGSSCAHFSIA